MAEQEGNGGPVSGAVKIGLFVLFIIIAIVYVVMTNK